MSLDSSWIVIESSPGPITARVGRRNPALDRLLARHGATGCTYLPEPLPAAVVDGIATADSGIPWVRVDAHRVLDDAYASIERGECWIGIPQRLAAYLAVEVLKRDTIYWHEVGKPTVLMPWTIPQFEPVPLRGPEPVTDPMEWK